MEANEDNIKETADENIQPAPKRGPKRKVYVPPTPTDDDTQRIVVKEYKTKSSRVLKGGVVKDYEGIAHRLIPYVETREYKTECRSVYNECISIIGSAIRDKKKLEAIRELLKRELVPQPKAEE